MAETHKRSRAREPQFIRLSPVLFVFWWTACDTWAPRDKTTAFWKNVTCKKCRLKAPKHWREKWGMA